MEARKNGQEPKENLCKRMQRVGWQARLGSRGPRMDGVLVLDTSCPLVPGPAAAQPPAPGGGGRT